MVTTMTKIKTVSEWMDENKLASSALAFEIDYSPGAVSKWRQKASFPSGRALKAILRAQKRCGWTPFPEKSV
jgi:DNA-binding transcriptional regulator YiaG